MIEQNLDLDGHVEAHAKSPKRTPKRSRNIRACCLFFWAPHICQRLVYGVILGNPILDPYGLGVQSLRDYIGARLDLKPIEAS